MNISSSSQFLENQVLQLPALRQLPDVGPEIVSHSGAKIIKASKQSRTCILDAQGLFETERKAYFPNGPGRCDYTEFTFNSHLSKFKQGKPRKHRQFIFG